MNQPKNEKKNALSNDLKNKSFEEKLEMLESIVKSMEQGDPALSDLLKAFQKGVALSEHLTHELEMIDKCIEEVVTDVQDDFETKPISVADEEEDKK